MVFKRKSATANGAALTEAHVVAALKSVFDPEIPVNIYDLGLIYEVNISVDNHVHVLMTLTTPNCPVAGSLPGDVANRIREIPEVADVNVELVWDPPWSMNLMTEAAKLELGLL